MQIDGIQQFKKKHQQKHKELLFLNYYLGHLFPLKDFQNTLMKYEKSL